MSTVATQTQPGGWLARTGAGLWWRVKEFAGAAGDATYLWPRWLVLRAVGVVYLFAFGGILGEGQALVGPQGIAPITGFLEHVRSVHPDGLAAFFRVPSLFWIESSGGMLTLLAWTGFASAMALVLNLWPRLALFVCWLVFLSFISVFHVFAPTVMDPLILETALLCIFFAPKGLRPGLGADSPPHPIALFMVRWLLFRVMFESGIIKLISGEPRWRDFTAMEVMYETAPFPTILGYLDHQMSHAYHVFEIILTFLAELLAPVLAVFAGRRGRWIALALWTLFQAGIHFTANFGWLNTAAIGLGLLLLDDQMIASAARWLRRPRLAGWLSARAAAGAATITRGGWGWRVVTVSLWLHFGLTFHAFYINWAAPTADFSYDKTRPWRFAYLDFKLANAYTPYETFVNRRVTVEFAGSNDGGRTWRPYRYRQLPQEENRVAAFISPRFLRFEGTVQIVGSTAEPTPFMPLVASHLLEGNARVIGLFVENPFPDARPTMIRMRLYQLEFTDLATQRATGNYWQKTYLGEYAPMIHVNREGRVQQAVTVLDIERAKAEEGNPEAQSNLGFMFASGRGASKRPAEAAKWFRLAAEQGWAEAQYNLGVILAEGTGVPADSGEALRWFRAAALQGHGPAQFETGVCYANGEGVRQDEIEALAWFTLAAAGNFADAARSREVLRERVGVAGGLAAQARVRVLQAEIDAARPKP
jgi:hypothetical protein